jgi:hypothetical protein
MRFKHGLGDKTLRKLQYNSVVEALFSAAPKVKDRYEAWRAEGTGAPLPYTVFGLVLEPFARNALKTGTERHLLQKLFAFLEERACSKDIEVVNLLYVRIFGTWVGERETLACTWKYMRERTKNLASDAAYRLNLGNNLPRGK